MTEPTAPALGVPAPPLLSLRDLRVTFPSEAGPVHAVRGLDLDLAPGQTVALVGESGSGKTAVALAVMGLHAPSASVTGSIRLGSTELLDLDDAGWSALRGRTLAMIFQESASAWTPVLTVGHQIAETILIHRQRDRAGVWSGAASTGGRRVQARRSGRSARKAAWDRAVDLLDRVGLPEPARRARCFPYELSGGMRQRAMIALAMANDPAVIVADEPTSSLDATVQAEVLAVLRQAQAATGAALLLITHDLGVVAGLADVVTVLYAGRAVEHGDLGEVFAHPRMPYTIGLLAALPGPRAVAVIEGSPPSSVTLPPGCPFAPRCRLAVDRCHRDEPDLDVTVPGGRHRAACHRLADIARQRLGVADLFVTLPPPRRDRGLAANRPNVMEITGLRHAFPGRSGPFHRPSVGPITALDGVDLTLRAGESLGLVGETGAGKSTLLRQIAELTAPQAGVIKVLGHDTARLSPHDRRQLRRDVQLVFQDAVSALDPRWPAFDLIAEPLRAFGWSAPAIRRRVDELFDLVGLEPASADRFARQFSGGQRSRLGIARALALNPRVLLLDEPVSALDVSIQAGIVALLRSLQDRFDLAYLLVAHDLAAVAQLCDRVAVLFQGRLVEQGAVAQVFGSPRHPHTQALVAASPLPFRGSGGAASTTTRRGPLG